MNLQNGVVEPGTTEPLNGGGRINCSDDRRFTGYAGMHDGTIALMSEKVVMPKPPDAMAGKAIAA